MEKTRKSESFLMLIEKAGNKLPNPATLFLLLSIFIVIVSAILSLFDISVTYTGVVANEKGDLITSELTTNATSLLSKEGITYIFSSMVKNFTSFPSLGTVLVALIGIGVAEKSGLIGIFLKKVALSTPKRLLTVVIVLLGVVSNVASDAGYVILPPLAALIFISFKRHPIAGITASFAGVSGGFSANLMLSTLDPMLAGNTQAAAQILNPNYTVSVTSNIYFLFTSTFLIAIIGTYVTEKIVEPRLNFNSYDYEINFENVTSEERKALKYAGFSFLLTLLFILLIFLIIGKDAFLSNSIVPVMAIIFLIPGITYGKCIKSIKTDSDVVNMISDSFKSMSQYIVLIFFASQFIEYFSYSKIGTIIAVNGANFLKLLDVPYIILIVIFILIVAIINLFMGSASAKWAILAPVFVPILMELNLSPEMTQLAYRIGDSTTNVISPLMPYFPMMVVFIQKYDKKASIGTLVSLMLPYSIAFLISWTILLIVWLIFDLPLGPNSFIFL